MPEKIQRVPRGLNDLLSLAGGQTPQLLADLVAPTLDLLQFYGMTQVQRVGAGSGTAAEGALLSVTVPQNQYWLLYQMGGLLVKTATMTAASVSLTFGPPTLEVGVFGDELGPFGATETGTKIFGMHLPYPRLLLPGWTIGARLDILGTDATASFNFVALVGVLG